MKKITQAVLCALLMVLMAATAFGAAKKPDAVSKGKKSKAASQVVSTSTDTNAASQVVSQGTDTKAASQEVQMTLKVPISSALFARVPVASVNDDVIRMNELTKALVSSHESRQDAGTQAGRIDYTKLLDRLINIRLVAQEAATIGLDDLPEFKKEMESNSRATLNAMVMADIAKDVKADPAEVEKRYKELAVEWKIQSILFEKEEDAKAMYDSLKAGTGFDELAKKAIDEKKAKGSVQGEYLKPKDLLPALASYVASMQTGSVSVPIRVQTGLKQSFTILKLEDKRYPENPDARQRAEQAALLAKKNETLAEYQKQLYATRVTINEKLLNKLDYDSPKANFTDLLRDTRTVADIKDGKKITVGQLTEGLQTKFYHGMEQAAKDKRINNAKSETLKKIIDEELITNEGVRRGIEGRDEYQDKIKEFRLTTLFSLFIEKAIIPDLQVSEDEMKTYFRSHQGDYTDPEMIKMVSLDFDNKRNAEAALAKLKKGADINWVRANADGLVVPSEEEGGQPGVFVVITRSLAPEMAKTVAGAKTGDFILQAQPEGRYSVLAILDVIPAKQQTYNAVRGEVAKKVYDNVFVRAMEDYFRKLRAAGDVKIYLSGIGK